MDWHAVIPWLQGHVWPLVMALVLMLVNSAGNALREAMRQAEKWAREHPGELPTDPDLLNEWLEGAAVTFARGIPILRPVPDGILRAAFRRIATWAKRRWGKG